MILKAVADIEDRVSCLEFSNNYILLIAYIIQDHIGQIKYSQKKPHTHNKPASSLTSWTIKP